MSEADVVIERRRVILVEDEAMSRTLLGNVLTSAGFEVESCASTHEAMSAFKWFDPDALVTDIDLGSGPSGLDLVVAMAKIAPYLGVVILSNYTITPDYRHAALGRAAYIHKQSLTDSQILVDALEEILHDRSDRLALSSTSGTRLSVLTPPQVQVLRMVAEGLNNDEIARRRQTSLKSVENMFTRIIAALGIEAGATGNARVLATRIYIEEAGMPTPESW